jgi:hypothetical protein
VKIEIVKDEEGCLNFSFWQEHVRPLIHSGASSVQMPLFRGIVGPVVQNHKKKLL